MDGWMENVNEYKSEKTIGAQRQRLCNLLSDQQVEIYSYGNQLVASCVHEYTWNTKGQLGKMQLFFIDCFPCFYCKSKYRFGLLWNAEMMQLKHIHEIYKMKSQTSVGAWARILKTLIIIPDTLIMVSLHVFLFGYSAPLSPSSPTSLHRM